VGLSEIIKIFFDGGEAKEHYTLNYTVKQFCSVCVASYLKNFTD